jgi:hypothetical protein
VGAPERAGLNTWRPYEHLAWSTEETLLRGATTVLHLAAENQIRVFGVHGLALVPLGYQPVPEGDRPQPDLTAMAEEEVLNQARVDGVRGDDALRALVRWHRTLTMTASGRMQMGVACMRPCGIRRNSPSDRGSWATFD